MESRRRYKRFGLVFLLVLAVLVGSAGWLTNQQIQQHKRNQALIAAIRANNTPAALDLLKKGADANAPDSSNHNVSMKELLVQKLRRQSTDRDITALIAALGVQVFHENGKIMEVSWPQEDLPLLKALLDKGADVNASGPNGFKPLHYAALSREHKALQLLLDHGADINVRTSAGRTALMLAVLQNDAEGVRLLLARNAKVDIKTPEGWTALSLARTRRIARILKQAGAKE